MMPVSNSKPPNNLANNFNLLILLFLCLMLCSFEGVAQNNNSELVDQTILFFNQGNFKDAEFTALRALQNVDSLSAIEQSELHRILGFTYVAQEENEKAKRQFIQWLELDPLATLNPIYISPKIIKVFDEAKEEYTAQKLPQNQIDNSLSHQRLLAIKKSLVFPGRGQLFIGENFKGASMVTGEIILLGALIYCHVQYKDKHDQYLAAKDPVSIRDLYDQSNLYYKGRIITASLAAGVYLYSLFDAAYYTPADQKRANQVSLLLSPNMEKLATLTINFTR
jgi:hypothetical protein